MLFVGSSHGTTKSVSAKGVLSATRSLEALKSLKSLKSIDNGASLLVFPSHWGSLESPDSLNL